MPVPPSGLPTGLTTSNLTNNIFFPNYHSWWGEKEPNLLSLYNLYYLGSATAQPTASTSVTMSSLSIPDGTDYCLIQPQSAPLSISYAAGTIGGMIVPTNAIFNLPMDKVNLSNLVISSASSQNVSVYFFQVLI
jgi:hypothetical protein